MGTLSHICVRVLALALVAGYVVLPPRGALAYASATLHVALVPDRAGARTTIEFALHISGPHGTPPPALTRMDLRLPASLGFATTQLGEANCNTQALLADGLQGCSANARIGFGEAVAVVAPGDSQIVERASLNMLMGPAANDRVQVLFYVEGLFPVFAQLVFPGLVMGDSPPFGEHVDTAVPLVPVWPEGPDLALEQFDSTIGPLHLTYHRQIDGRTVSYEPHGFRLPARCPRGGFPFAAQLSFADGTQLAASDRVHCG